MPKNSGESLDTLMDARPAEERTITMSEVGQASMKAYEQIIERVCKKAEEKSKDTLSTDIEFTETEAAQLIEIIPSLFYGIEDPTNTSKLQNIMTTLSDFVHIYGDNKYVSQIEQAFHKEVTQNLTFIEKGIENSHDAWGKMRFVRLINDCTRHKDRETRAVAVNWLVNNTKNICDIYFENPYNDSFFADVIDTIVNKTGGDRYREFHETISSQFTERMNADNCGILAELLMKEGYSSKKFAKELTISIAQQKLGLPATIVEAWAESVSDDETTAATKRNSYNRNIIGAFELDKAIPGCAAELHKRFGIANFGRYPKEILLRQYEKRNDSTTPYGIAVMAYSDHNSAFMSVYDQFSDVYKNFKEHGDDKKTPDHELRIIEGSQKYTMMRQLIAMRRINGPIEYAILGGHGTQYSIGYGPGVGTEYNLLAGEIFGYVREEKKFNDTPRPQATKAVERLFVENPTIVLASCYTGKGNENIAEMLSRLGMIVTAPDNKAQLEDFYVHRKGKKAVLTSMYRGAMAKTWFNGKELTKEEIENLYDEEPAKERAVYWQE